MTVADLIADLLRLPQDALVVMSRDAEGNGYSPLHEMETWLYRAHTSWEGDLVDEASEGEEARPTDQQAVVLWPAG